jgi:LacI family transcriptional regulator
MTENAADRARLTDIAAAVGVSVATVSKVLNGHADVAAETRSRVAALLADHNYTVRRRPRRVFLIDLVFSDLTPWSMEIIRGAEEAAFAQDCRVTVSVVSSAVDMGNWMARLSTSQTDGVILVLTELSPAYRARLAAMNMPVVIVDPVGQPDPTIPTVGATNWAGGLTATEHLIDIGHQRIGTITGRMSLLCSRARLDGYRAALERAGFPLDRDLIAPGDFTFESALAAAASLLSLPDPPTAIFASSDAQALGVYEAARRHRLRIPDDLSVVGFDDLPMSAWVSPPLTTVVQPLAQMAAMATRMLVATLNDRADAACTRVELTTSLIVRASTAPPPVPAARC